MNLGRYSPLNSIDVSENGFSGPFLGYFCAGGKLEFLFHPIDIDANETSNLDEENLIGSGGSGKVYRLELEKKGGTVAVKQLWKGNSAKLMLSETETPGKIRHKNIIKLYACLMRGGSNYLVYEYMANGNLFHALRRTVKSGRPELDWYQRYKITVGAAKGVANLRYDCTPPIIHRDTNPPTYYLTKTSRLRLQILESQGQSIFLIKDTNTAAPVPAYTLKVSEKTDVYSFSVVLLEIVTGRCLIEDVYGDGRDIAYHFHNNLGDREDATEKVLDKPVVASKSTEDDMIKVLKAAILCTLKLPSLRPNMREEVKMLTDADPCLYKSAEYGSAWKTNP